PPHCSSASWGVSGWGREATPGWENESENRPVGGSFHRHRRIQLHRRPPPAPGRRRCSPACRPPLENAAPLTPLRRPAPFRAATTGRRTQKAPLGPAPGGRPSTPLVL